MIPLKQINKNKKWYEDIANYYLPSTNEYSNENYEELKGLYELFNNDLTRFEDDLNKMCNNLIDLGAAKENIKSYNKIRNKFEVLAGDLLLRADVHRIVLLTSKAVRNKDEQLKTRILESVQKDVGRALEQAIPMLEKATPEEIEQFIKEYETKLTPNDINYKTYLSELEIYKNKMLKYTYLTEDITAKKIESFKHLFISDRMYLYNGWEHGRPKIKVINPLFAGHHKSPNQEFVHKGDYFWYSEEVSIGEALDHIINAQKPEMVKKILEYSSYYNSLSEDHMKKFIFDHARYYGTNALTRGDYFREAGIGAYQDFSGHSEYRRDRITKTHLEFKAYKEVMFYSYFTEYGKKVTIILDKKATDVIPENANKVKYLNKYHNEQYKYVWTDDFGQMYEAELMWIPRRYELTRWGEDIYTDMREVPFQPDYTDAPYTRFNLSYKGGVVNAMNANALSLMQNALPYQLQYIAIKHLQNREMAKYRGFEVIQDVDQIPQQLADDRYGTDDPLLNNEIVARKTGTRYYSGSQRTNGLPVPATRGAGAQGTVMGSSAEFMNLQNFAQAVDMEIGMAVGVPPSREGQLQPYTNVSDNQQSLHQTSLTSQLYYTYHQRVWAEALDEHLVNYDTYFEKYFEENPEDDETILEYIAPDGVKELLKVKPDYLNHDDIGLFLQDTSNDRMYFQIMLQKIQQNTMETSPEEVSEILKAITSGASKEEVDRMIKVVSERAQLKQQQMMEQQQQLMAQQEQLKRETEEYKSDRRLEEIISRATLTKETAIETAKVNAESNILAKQYDINQNKQNDLIEKDKLKYEHETKLENDRQQHEKEENQKDRELKKMEIKSRNIK